MSDSGPNAVDGSRASTRSATRADLVALARALGDPTHELVVLSEGNAAARHRGETLLVTASGSALPTTEDREIVEAAIPPLLDFVRSGRDAGLGEVRELLVRACTEPGSPRPSIETLMHAVVLDRTGVTYIGHTHPTPLVGLLCTTGAARLFERPLFPDEAVVCGPFYAYVPYASPGLPLARAVDDTLAEHVGRHGEPPRAVLLENHGLIALGSTSAEVLAVTTMAVKAARVRLVALGAGGIETLSAEEARSLVDRPDEKLRRSRLVAGES